MDFAEGGELFYMLREKGRMSENEAIFYSAQIVLAIEHLHSMGVLYRDLKPENILLDKSGYLLLTDFGLAKKISKTNSFCGTPDYIPPEIIRNKEYSTSVDWWQLGVLIYELIVGHTPFYDYNVDKMFRNIVKKKLKRHPSLSEKAYDLVSLLLQKDPELRLGHGPEDAKMIKKHAFFNELDWDLLNAKEIEPPVDLTEKPLKYFDKKSLVRYIQFCKIRVITIRTKTASRIDNLTHFLI